MRLGIYRTGLLIYAADTGLDCAAARCVASTKAATMATDLDAQDGPSSSLPSLSSLQQSLDTSSPCAVGMPDAVELRRNATATVDVLPPSAWLVEIGTIGRARNGQTLKMLTGRVAEAHVGCDECLTHCAGPSDELPIVGCWQGAWL